MNRVDLQNNLQALHMLPGDHFFLHSSEKLLLQMLSDELWQIAGQPAWNTLRV